MESKIKGLFNDLIAERNGRVFLELEECTSTNDEAKKLMSGGGECVVISGRQTAGRGRLGRSFDSEEGGLYMSVGRRPSLSPEQCMPVTALAGLAVSRAVDAVCSAGSMVKWPNDVLIEGKKICGILTEAVHSSQGFYIIIGMGTNLKNRLPEELSKAGSILDITGAAPEPMELASEILKNLDEILEEFEKKGTAGLMEAYSDRCVNIGREVSASAGNEHVCGIVEGVDGEGALLVRKEGKLVRVMSGEATLRNQGI